MSETIIQHLLNRLKQLGIRDIFGVPGDYAFPINNAICDDKELLWIGCCNELNALMPPMAMLVSMACQHCLLPLESENYPHYAA